MKILPSIMGKNQQSINSLFSKLKGAAKDLHLDIADGKFVPNTSLNFPLRLPQTFTYSAHLMVNTPLPWLQKYSSKIHTAFIHPEPLTHKKLLSAIHFLKEKNINVGLALHPRTHPKSIQPVLPLVDAILILTVKPGFYGAKFLKSPLKKIAHLLTHKPQLKIYVDGGMTPKTAPLAKHAGATHIVSGSFIATSDNPKKALRELKQSLK